MTMQISSKYDLGDKVWVGMIRYESARVPCDLCDGTTRVGIYGTSEQARCPRCDNQGKIASPATCIGYVNELTIGRVGLRVLGFENAPGYDEVTEEYMCWETGVGTGSNWPVEKLWATRELATEWAVGQGAVDVRDKVPGATI